MQANGWIYRRNGCSGWLSYQPRIQDGLMVHKTTRLGADDDGTERIAQQVRVTGKGMTLLAKRLNAEAQQSKEA